MSTDASSQTVLDRVQSFVSEHKQAIIIGASVAVAVGGVAYYASTSRRPPPGDLEGGTTKSRSKKKSKKRKGVKDADGPILEEIEPKPKVEDETSGKQSL
jgi:import receptor subunit TOM70